MKIKRKALTVTALLLCVCTISLIGNTAKKASLTSSKVIEKPQIILDAGHGGLTNTIN